MGSFYAVGKRWVAGRVGSKEKKMVTFDRANPALNRLEHEQHF